MTLTIMEKMDGIHIYGHSKTGKDIHEVSASGRGLYYKLQKIADYVNNELGEECLFEVD